MEELEGLREFGLAHKDDLIDPEEWLSVASPVAKSVEYQGKTYPSLFQCAREHSVSPQNMFYKLNHCKHAEGNPIVYKGEHYASRYECARITGRPYQSISLWIQRHRDVQPGGA